MPNMPDFPKEQVAAVLLAILSQGVAIGWLDADQQTRIFQIAMFILPTVWVLASALLRGKRAHAVATAAVLQASAHPTPPMVQSSDSFESLVSVPTEPDQGDLPPDEAA